MSVHSAKGKQVINCFSAAYQNDTIIIVLFMGYPKVAAYLSITELNVIYISPYLSENMLKKRNFILSPWGFLM